MGKEYKRDKNFRLNNVSVASYGYWENYNSPNYRFDPELEAKLKPYVENNCLKTDIKSLSEVAKILDGWNGDMVVVNGDGTITFYNGDY
jgi:hypothetical protein